jgi:hypothetical protein
VFYSDDVLRACGEVQTQRVGNQLEFWGPGGVFIGCQVVVLVVHAAEKLVPGSRVKAVLSWGLTRPGGRGGGLAVHADAFGVNSRDPGLTKGQA